MASTRNRGRTQHLRRARQNRNGSRRCQPPGPWRVHVDGAYDWQQNRMTFAACVYSPSGRLLLRRIGAQPGGCSAEAEARAALVGVCAIRELTDANPPAGWQLIGDHRGIIDMLTGRRQCTAERLRPFIDETMRLMGDCDPVWVKRDQNFPAHWAASQTQHAVDGTMVDLPALMPGELEQLHRATIRAARRLARYACGEKARRAHEFLRLLRTHPDAAVRASAAAII